VVLFDYGSGNIRSGERALTRAGASVEITSSVGTALDADGVVIPGVGAFGACARALRAVDGPRMVWERREKSRPVLAICVGHQVLFTRGDEHGESSSGLGIWPGDVSAVAASVLPHVGWNTVSAHSQTVMLAGIEKEYFYFVHSYAAHQSSFDGWWIDPPRTSMTSYGGDTFVAAVEQGSLWSTQFHPEKSGDAGAALLRNWVGTLG
jgi:imidazole glycerol-phosphate synthase subunit HisH